MKWIKENKLASVIILLIILAIIGYFTNWFGLGKKKNETSTGRMYQRGGAVGVTPAGRPGVVQKTQNSVICDGVYNRCISSGGTVGVCSEIMSRCKADNLGIYAKKKNICGGSALAYCHTHYSSNTCEYICGA